MYLNQVYHHPIMIQPTRELPKWVGIIGAGAVGSGIGYYLKSTIPDLKLVLIDSQQQALDRAVERINAYADNEVKRGRLLPEQADEIRQHILASTEYEVLAYCDWVIEAVTEHIHIKQQVFSQVEAIVDERCLITSNTRTIPAAWLFSHLAHPERTTVTHFLAPALPNSVVEVIEWEKSAPLLIQYLRWLCYVTGKVPLLIKDMVCFMLHRVFDNWCNEAALLLAEATPAQIDTVAAEYAHAGPFYLLNRANGNAALIRTLRLLAEIEGDHYAPAAAFERDAPDEDMAWETIKPGEHADVSVALQQAIAERLLGVLFSQAVDILDRGIGTAEDLDLGCRLAFGFKTGPLELMHRLGADEVRRITGRFARQRPGLPVASCTPSHYVNCHCYLLLDELDGVKIITLRRPDAVNALHDAMIDEVIALLQNCEDDDGITGVVITGYGMQAFCAGADIDRLPSVLGDKAALVAYAQASARLVIRLDQCSKPVVAALNGAARGAGLELAMRCHGIVSSADAYLQFPEITLGLVPGTGALVVPYRRWPGAATTFHQMLLKADKLNAARATALGIINTLVDKPINLVPAAVWLAKELAQESHQITDAPVNIAPVIAEIKQPRSAEGQRLSASVVSIMHKAIHTAAAAGTFAEALEIGYQAFAESACTAAAREGIRAFTERRRPDFEATG